MSQTKLRVFALVEIISLILMIVGGAVFGGWGGFLFSVGLWACIGVNFSELCALTSDHSTRGSSD